MTRTKMILSAALVAALPAAAIAQGTGTSNRGEDNNHGFSNATSDLSQPVITRDAGCEPGLAANDPSCVPATGADQQMNLGDDIWMDNENERDAGGAS
ncbi:hypothetical protein [Psychromarinibacter halotolerans]|uniref:Uncharacterized protein n=1 Tax=Psychromarinibacter halotolerans TaxID=1775175 RepID=A0ABV7GTI5_9RHOB|nr:hypothetical protein [Psychromarinibacter halotolerans]MAQ81871.1 hypothetical protein [Maritimibacter sp.]MDF0597075.1 hypothetical protein [Psychromarinibacter halotolerans]